MSRSIEALVAAAKQLAREVEQLKFAAPVAYVYNPLTYAWAPHEAYLRRFGGGPKRVIFLGMNPGPFGMVQTGVPFGEVKAVRDWLKIDGPVGQPERAHPSRPVKGFACERSEVSGQRLWGLFAQRFGVAEEFFKAQLVMNYCPLAFMEDTGRNRTPDKLRAGEKARLFAACDRHLVAIVQILQPKWLIGIGDFAARRAELACQTGRMRLGRILHPSPANPAANRDWPGIVTRQLIELGVWGDCL